MTELDSISEQDDTNRGDRRRPNIWTWVGLLVVFVGAVSYFVFFYRFPALRDFPWVNLPIVGAGLVMSAVGLRRAWADPGRTALAKASGSVAFVVSLSLTALFCGYIFYLSYQLPETDQVVQVSQIAPDFALPDQDGQIVRLSDLQGSLVVIDFYRGHW